MAIRSAWVSALRSARVTWRTLRYIFSHTPVAGSLSLVLTAFAACTPLLMVWLTKRIVDLLFGAAKSHGAQEGSALLYFAAAYVIASAILPVFHVIRRRLAEHMRDRLSACSEISLLEKLSTFKGQAYFEIPEFHDKVRNAQQGAGARFCSVVDMLTGVFSSILCLAGSCVLLIQLHWAICVVVLIGILPNTIQSFNEAKNLAGIFRSQAEGSRMLGYFRSVLTERRTSKEVRAFGLADYFLDRYRQKYGEMYRQMLSFRLRAGALGAVTAVWSGLTTGGVFAWLCLAAYRGSVTVGDMVLYVGLLPQITQGFFSLVNCVTYTYKNSLFVGHFFDFMNLPPALSEPAPGHAITSLPDPDAGFELQNVSFKYPGSSTYVLKDISVTIPVGRTVAIVGRNGAGKSTLVKLLLRLYDPSAGRVLFAGRALPDYDLECLRSHVAAVFQDFARYSLTAQHNIALGAPRRIDQEEAIVAAARSAGADGIIQALPSGYHTLLGKEFAGGADLSEGQWQRVALARAFFREAAVILLDEPTSAMDPEAEYTLFRHFHKLMDGKTGILISHRLSNVRMADTIIVLDEGRLVQMGTHDELIRAGGLYRELFRMQASGYGVEAGDSETEYPTPM